jgi:tRNA G18 (ribose-2'-O)-methylase SpoU
MSFFEIGIFAPVHQENIGTLWRSAYQSGAIGIFTIGKGQRIQASDTARSHLQIPLRNYQTWEDFLQHRPVGAQIIAVEMGGKPLKEFQHPDRAIYVLGSEANGFPDYVLNQCDQVVSIESVRHPSYNVAVAGSIVMYHRLTHLGLEEE